MDNRDDVNQIHEIVLMSIVSCIQNASSHLRYFRGGTVQASDETKNAVHYYIVQLLNHASYYGLIPQHFEYHKGMIEKKGEGHEDQR